MAKLCKQRKMVCAITPPFSSTARKSLELDAPPNSPPGPDGPKRYLAAAFKRFPDIQVTIEDMIAEGDKVVVRNTWRATDSTTGKKIEFGGIVIWRIAQGQLVERWAYLKAPHPVH
jgi:predicted ester cyclase